MSGISAAFLQVAAGSRASYMRLDILKTFSR
jgi:hypothetical protein